VEIVIACHRPDLLVTRIVELEGKRDHPRYLLAIADDVVYTESLNNEREVFAAVGSRR
jgi:hypothetical protein